jgi:hypothetical protein
MMHPYSGLQNNPSKKPGRKQVACFRPGFLLGLYFDPKEEDEMFFRNVGSLSTDYTALYPKR